MSNRVIGLMSRVFANGPEDRGTNPKSTQKMVFDSDSLTTQHYKVKVKWSNPRNVVVPPLHLGVVAIEKGAFESPSTMVANVLLQNKNP